MKNQHGRVKCAEGVRYQHVLGNEKVQRWTDVHAVAHVAWETGKPLGLTGKGGRGWVEYVDELVGVVYLGGGGGTTVKAPMCCVMPPASPAATVVLRSASSRLVFPWST